MASNEPPDWQQGQPPAQPPQEQPPPGYPQQPGQYPQQPGQYPQQPGQYPQQQYPPGYGPPGYPPRKTNGLAIASLVLGLLWICYIGSILALVFGYQGKKQIDASQGREEGRGLAVAGIVLGWI